MVKSPKSKEYGEKERIVWRCWVFMG